MNVGELKEWLKQFDDDTIVEIVYHSTGFGYYDQGGNATTYEFNPDMYLIGDHKYCHTNHFEYTVYKGVSTLLLGAYEA